MAFFQCNFYSQTINSATSFNVIIPQHGVCKNFPTLYLLHGYTDDFTMWQRKTSLERYANQYCMAIVMPDVHKSFYNNFPGIEVGYRYWDYVSQELLDVSRNFFHLSDRREDTFAAGLSMGGFGALKLGLNCPDRFSAVASLSGVTDVRGIKEAQTQQQHEFQMLFGDLPSIENSSNDLFYLSDMLSHSPNLKPKIYQACGTEDFLYEDNVRFKEHMRKLSFDYFYTEGPGAHTWDYWDMHIEKVLAWLPVERVAAL